MQRDRLSSEQWVERISALIDMRQFERAGHALQQALSDFPQDVQVQAYGALLMYRWEKYPQSQEFGRQVIDLDPSWSYGYRIRAWAMLDGHDAESKQQPPAKCNAEPAWDVYRKANELADRAVELAPWDGNSFVLKAYCAYRLGELARAEEALGEAFRLDPENSDACWLRVLLHEIDRQPAAALSAARAGLKLYPEEPFYHRKIASQLLARGEYPQALEHAQQAIRLQPGLPLNQRLYWDCFKTRTLPGRLLYRFSETLLMPGRDALRQERLRLFRMVSLSFGILMLLNALIEAWNPAVVSGVVLLYVVWVMFSVTWPREMLFAWSDLYLKLCSSEYRTAHRGWPWFWSIRGPLLSLLAGALAWGCFTLNW